MPFKVMVSDVNLHPYTAASHIRGYWSAAAALEQSAGGGGPVGGSASSEEGSSEEAPPPPPAHPAVRGRCELTPD